MNYAEELPNQCPPDDANDEDLGTAWRCIDPDGPTISDFDSHAKKGRANTTNADDCRWASCSLTTTEQAAIAKLKLPGLKGKVRVAIKIPAGSGKSYIKGKHIDFWRYANFDPLKHIVPGSKK